MMPVWHRDVALYYVALGVRRVCWLLEALLALLVVLGVISPLMLLLLLLQLLLVLLLCAVELLHLVDLEILDGRWNC